MSIIETAVEKVRDALVPDEEETVFYELQCTECGTTFTTKTDPDDATCESCGSSDLSEEGRMYAGGVGGSDLG